MQTHTFVMSALEIWIHILIIPLLIDVRVLCAAAIKVEDNHANSPQNSHIREDTYFNGVERRTIDLNDLITSGKEDTKCEISIWDSSEDSPGVRHLPARCQSGSVTWRAPRDALHFSLAPLSHLNPSSNHPPSPRNRNPFDVCFRLTAQLACVKLSRDVHHDANSGSDVDDTHDVADFRKTHDVSEGSTSYRLHELVRFNHSDTSLSEYEHCVYSEYGDPVRLYAEVDGGHVTSVHGSVLFEYDITGSLDPSRTLVAPHPVYKSPKQDDGEEMDPCRPCTDEEILYHVCASQFVAHGSIISAENPESLLSITRLKVHAHTVFRQSAPVFIKDHAPFTGTGVSSGRVASDFASLRRHSISTKTRGDFHAALHAARRCGATAGEGEFVFVGRVRLGRAVLQCAPRWEEFEELWRAAVKDGRNLCTLE